MDENINLEKEAHNLGEKIRDIKHNNSQSGLNDKYTQKEENNTRIKQLDLIQLEGRNLFEKKIKIMVMHLRHMDQLVYWFVLAIKSKDFKI